MSDLGLQRVGETIGGAGTAAPFRADITGAQVVTDGHGRYAEANRRGRLFSTGMVATSINNVTFTVATLGATCTPIVGVWNPPNSPVNLEILAARLAVIMTALQATGPGGFAWAAAVNQSALTLGLVPVNRRSLMSQGAYAKGYANVALTGLVGNLTVLGASTLCGGSAVTAAFLATQVGLQTQQTAAVEELAGAFIVPPGGVLALLAGATPVAHSAASMLEWEEVPNLQ